MKMKLSAYELATAASAMSLAAGQARKAGCEVIAADYQTLAERFHHAWAMTTRGVVADYNGHIIAADVEAQA